VKEREDEREKKLSLISTSISLRKRGSLWPLIKNERGKRED
jgi:hypothetical protein